MRSRFISWLLDYCNEHENCYLLVADLGFSVIEEFADRFPNRFLNVGIAEQNMAGIAAGIASQGNQVFCYSIGNFTTFFYVEIRLIEVKSLHKILHLIQQRLRCHLLNFIIDEYLNHLSLPLLILTQIDLFNRSINIRNNPIFINNNKNI